MMEPLEGNMAGTQEPGTVSTKQQRIAQMSARFPQRAFISLAHVMDLDWLREAYRRTRKDASAGVDGQTAKDYEQDLEGNLHGLLERAKAGTYFAPPVRRVHIPKSDGKSTRPIGVPTLEDKVLQRAVTMVLEPLYEQDFLDCSFGFRPGRSAHRALGVFWQSAMAMGGGWVIELDIESYFDSLNHAQLRAFIERRVRDGVLCRLIDKWLRAGVMEDGMVTYPNAGSPQGGVVSPILSNIYLHEVLDRWFEADVKPRLRGRAFNIRFADDAVLCFANEADARRVLAVLPKRFAKFGLTLHPTKTRLVRFTRPSRRLVSPQPATFDFLGFTHYWGRSRQGNWVIQRTTAKDRFRRALFSYKLWCRRYRHLPVREQHAHLGKKLRGHYAYYGITGNIRSLQRIRLMVERIWLKWLRRRSQRGRFNWDHASCLLARYPLPAARIVHSYLRHAAKPSSGEPDALVAHVRIYGGPG
jgi:group II intron reverse transcriptase/maturase